MFVYVLAFHGKGCYPLFMELSVVILYAFVVASTTAAAFSSTELANKNLQQAYLEFDKAQYDHAQRNLRTVLDNKKSSHDEVLTAKFLRARIHAALGHHDLAIEQLQQLESDVPEIKDILWDLSAQSYRQLGQWQRAKSLWQTILRETPNSPKCLQSRFSIADAQLALGEIRDARRSYEQAIRLYPTAEPAKIVKYTRLTLLAGEQRYAEAARGFRELYLRDIEHPLNKRALAQYQQLQKEHKIRDFTFKEILQRTDRLLATWRFGDATDHLQTLQAQATTQEMLESVRERLAILAYKQKNYETAASHFQALVNTATGHNKDIYEQWLARTFAADGKLSQAIELYGNISQKPWSHASDALYKSAWLLYQNKEYQASEKLFDEFLRRYPWSQLAADAQWYKAWNAYKRGDLQTAYDKLLSLRRRARTLLHVQRADYWAARVLEQMGQSDGAKLLYQEISVQTQWTYYDVLASQRLQAVSEMMSPVIFVGGDTRIASLNDLPTIQEVEAIKQSDKSNGKNVLENTAVTETDIETLFDIQSPLYKRFQRLVQLGFTKDAASMILDLPTRVGVNDFEIELARAQLFYQLDEYYLALRQGSRLHANINTETERNKYQNHFNQLAYPQAHRDLVLDASSTYQISPTLVWAVMRQESAFRSQIYSSASARGLMQIIPITARKIAESIAVPHFEESLLETPDTNVEFGSFYLASLLRKFYGNMILAIASYNAGPKAVTSWVDDRPGAPLDEFVEDIPFRETRDYVKNVIGNMAAYHFVYEQKPVQLPGTIPSGYLPTVDF